MVCLKKGLQRGGYGHTRTPLATPLHSAILGPRQHELFNCSNKDLFLRKTLLKNVSDYSVNVMLMSNLILLTKEFFRFPVSHSVAFFMVYHFYATTFFKQVYTLGSKLNLPITTFYIC